VNGRSATLTDTLTGEQQVVYAEVVVNATGVWAADVADGIRVSPSRGTHLVVRSSSLGDPRAILTVPVPGTLGRYVFAIPHPDGICYVGITDEPAPGEDPYAPTIPDDDVTFMLETLSIALSTKLTRDDVVGAFAGLRPLISDAAADSTAELSRRHVLVDRPGQPLTITGGKLTTYRQMAEDTVDAALKRLGRRADCVTKTLPLVGAAERNLLRKLDAPERLIRRFGTEAPSVAALADDEPSLLEPVSPRSPILGVEVVYAVLAEGAISIDDFLDRRVRAGFVSQDREDIRWECTKIFDRAVAQLRTRR
jgi:glycerol-3-phosphate dehydrogenase